MPIGMPSPPEDPSNVRLRLNGIFVPPNHKLYDSIHCEMELVYHRDNTLLKRHKRYDRWGSLVHTKGTTTDS